MSSAYRIGLTGGIGSGKTTVCNIFCKLDVPIIDTDIIARKVVQPGTQGLNAIQQKFGNSILTENKSLDRDALRRLVFDDPDLRKSLNSIMHPLIYKKVKDEISHISFPYCIVSIPLLFETGGEEYVDRVLVIDSTVENQLARSSKRDGVNRSQILKIINAQMDRKARKKRADDIISNNGNQEQLQEQVKILHKRYLNLAKTSTLSKS